MELKQYPKGALAHIGMVLLWAEKKTRLMGEFLTGWVMLVQL